VSHEEIGKFENFIDPRGGSKKMSSGGLTNLSIRGGGPKKCHRGVDKFIDPRGGSKKMSSGGLTNLSIRGGGPKKCHPGGGRFSNFGGGPKKVEKRQKTQTRRI